MTRTYAGFDLYELDRLSRVPESLEGELLPSMPRYEFDHRHYIPGQPGLRKASRSGA